MSQGPFSQSPFSRDSGVGSVTPQSSSTSTVAPAATTASTANSVFSRIGSTASQGLQSIDSGARNAYNYASNQTNQALQYAASARQNLQSTLGGYDKYLGNMVSGSSIFSKMIFLIAVVVVFLLLVSVGTAIITAVSNYSRKPYLLKNLKSGTEQVVIPQDPRTAHSVPLLRSRNQEPGVEFTYSTWIYIDELPRIPEGTTGPIYKHVFHQGTPDGFTKEGMSQPVNTPGLYITTSAAENGAKQNVDLTVVMSTFEDPQEQIILRDIPLDKWIHVVIVLKGQVLDVYINGTIAGRHILSGGPMQSYGPLNMSLNGGLTGKMSTTQYFAYALSPVQIANISSVNPSLQEAHNGIDNPFPPYLSLRWYTGSSSI